MFQTERSLLSSEMAKNAKPESLTKNDPNALSLCEGGTKIQEDPTKQNSNENSFTDEAKRNNFDYHLKQEEDRLASELSAKSNSLSEKCIAKIFLKNKARKEAIYRLKF